MEAAVTVKKKTVVLITRFGVVLKSEIRKKLCNASYKVYNAMVHFAVDSDSDFALLYEKHKVKNSIPISVLNKLLFINDIQETIDIVFSNAKTESNS